MGTFSPPFNRTTARIFRILSEEMSSYFSSSSSMRASSELPENSLAARFEREFYNPERISLSGNYYPRYKVTGCMESGSAHVSYLGRSYFSYKVPSVYGYSKFVTVRKI